MWLAAITELATKRRLQQQTARYSSLLQHPVLLSTNERSIKSEERERETISIKAAAVNAIMIRTLIHVNGDIRLEKTKRVI